jgi:hypothetical protein
MSYEVWCACHGSDVDVHATDPTMDVHVSYSTDIDTHTIDTVEQTIDVHVRSINNIRCACQTFDVVVKDMINTRCACCKCNRHIKHT